jgi:hypothetical protein
LLKAARNELQDRLHARDATIEELDKKLQIAVGGLYSALVDIDVDIDAQYPADAHPYYAERNKWLRAGNPARVALEKIHNYPKNTSGSFSQKEPNQDFE